MNHTSQFLLYLAIKSLHNQNYEETINTDIDWNAVYAEAYAHQIHTLIYPAVNKLGPIHGPNSQLISTWRTETFLSAAKQIQHIQKISEVFATFNNAAIPAIALKGLVLRELYPQPELRIMVDADILVPPQYLKDAKNVLIQMGYNTGNTGIKHVSFYHNDYPAIELHWTLIDDHLFKTKANIEFNVWEYAVPRLILGTPALALSVEDQIFHLIIHMISHMKSSGFGLRQLFDFILTIETNAGIICWSNIYQRVQEYEIQRFVQSIFLVCKRLFNMPIPDLFLNQSLEQVTYIDVLIDDILKGGVYGKRIPDRKLSSIVMYYNKNTINSFSKLEHYISLLFPPVQKLKFRFTYLQKVPLLLPIAWIHRFVYNLIHKDIRLSFKAIFLPQNVLGLYEHRSKLLQWLELH